MRRKNRQLKITLDIPDQYEDDDAFMTDLMDTMDSASWNLKVGDEKIRTPVSSMVLGDVEIGPEEEEG